MPARSKSQQRLFGMLHAYNKGEFSGSKSLKNKLSEMSRHISDEDVRHFAETKHEDLPEKKASIVKISGLSKARQLIDWYIKRRKTIADAVRTANQSASSSTTPIKTFFGPTSDADRLLHRLRRELIAELNLKATGVFNTETSIIGTPPKRTPRMALFRGAPRLSATGPGFNPASGYGHVDIPHVSGSQYSHATGDVDTASKGTYGRLLEVYNAKKVPGAVSGKLKWFKDTHAQDVANEDFTAVRGLYSGTGDRSVLKKLLSRESPGYETLIQTSKLRPDRLYLVRSGAPQFHRNFMDITALKDMYFNSKSKKYQRAIGELIGSLH